MAFAAESQPHAEDDSGSQDGDRGQSPSCTKVSYPVWRQYLNFAVRTSVRGLPKLISCAFGVVPWM